MYFYYNIKPTKSECTMFHIPEKMLSSGLHLPVLGAGTWRIGGNAEADYTCDDAAVAALQATLDDGFTHIDTAEMYGAGHTEELLGRALRGRRRNTFQITGKVWKTHFSYDGVLGACDASLARLGIDYFDLYLIHQPLPGADWTGLLRGLEKLVHDGKVHHLGVSNFTPEHWTELQNMTEFPLEVNQVHYNLVCREAEFAGLPEYCEKHDKLLMAWRPLQKGAIALDHPLMREMCGKYRKTPVQVALNYLICQPRVVTVSAMSDAAHRAENAGACDWSLAPEDRDRLRREWPGKYARSEAVPLG